MHAQKSSKGIGADIGAGSERRARKSWSEWQDLNLRPPRPERVSLSQSSTFIDNFDNVRAHRFTFGFVISVGKLSG